jgi:hypothetical protein
MKDAQVGFNTNVVYHGQTLHIQTEDSGRGRPHVITHLYSGGTILATKRTSYEHLAGAEDLRDKVRELMKTQHKAMVVELRDGVHDAAIHRALDGGPSTSSSEPPPVAEPPPADGPPPQAPHPPVTPWPDLDSSPPPLAAAPSGLPDEPRAAQPPDMPSPPSRPSVPPAPTPIQAREHASYRPPAPAPSEPDVVFPVDGIGAEHATARARGRRAGGLRPAVDREREGFGKDLISDRSLDEVVLSYLAEELTKEEK